MNIRLRLIATYVLVATIPVFFISYVDFSNSKEAVVVSRLAGLESVVDLKVAIINDFFSNLRKDVAVSQGYYNIKHNLSILARNIGSSDNAESRSVASMLDAQLLTLARERGDIDDFMLLAPDGRVVYSNAGFLQQDRFARLRYDPDSSTFIGGKSGVFISKIFTLTGTHRDGVAAANGKTDHDFYVTAPVNDELGNFIGEIAVLVDSRNLAASVVNSIKGLGETGEVVVGSRVSEIVPVPERFAPLFSFPNFGINPEETPEAFLRSADDLPAKSTYGGGEGSGQTIDYRGKDVLAAWRYVPALDWEVMVKIDLEEAFIPMRALAAAAWFLGGIAALLIMLVSFIFSFSIAEPLRALVFAADRVRAGDLHSSIPEALTVSHDEIGTLARAFDAMTARLRESYEGLERKVKEKTRELVKSLSDVERQNTQLNDSRNSLANLVEDLKKEKEFSEYNVNEMKKFKLAVDGASDHIIIADVDGRIVYANSAAEKTTGYSRAEMLGKRPSLWGGLMPKEFYANLWETIKVKKQPFEGEINNGRKSGEPYIAHTSIVPLLDTKGNLLFFVGVERDITKEKEIDRAKSEFISLATHQLRTPLTTMKWIPEMLLEGALGKLSAKQRKYIEDLHSSADRLVSLINQLLDISRIESRRLDFNIEDVPVAEMFHNLKFDFAHEVGIREQQLVFKPPEPEVLRTDRRLLGEVLRNFISNAVKYTPNKGRIEVAFQPSARGFVRFSVKDNGMGVPKEVQKRLFEKFFRADNAAKVDVSGTGLGLYVARGIATSLGGTVTFESGEGKGTTFFVDLPVAGPSPQTP